MKNTIIALTTASCLFAGSAFADVEISTKGGLKVKTGDYKFQLGGRIMYDYNNAKLNDVTDEDAFGLRRGRIYVKGNVAKNWSFKSQFNTDGSGVEDMYIRYTGWGKNAVATIGNQRVPFGLEDITSSNDISVLERSAITELFAPTRKESVQIGGKKLPVNATYAVTLFSDGSGKNENFGYSARYTIAPIKTGTSLIHVGLAYQDLSDDNAFGIEFATVQGPFHLQAEYMDGEFANVDVDGAYIQFGYVLTGESRPYKGGKFKRVKPSTDSGAWEVVARYEDGDGSHSDIELGDTDATAYTLGVNWYAHKNVRFGLNYTEGERNSNDGEGLDGDEGEEIRARFQLTF